MYKTILEETGDKNCWLSFLAYKTEKHHLSYQEEAKLRSFIDNDAYLPLCDAWQKEQYPAGLPVKCTINKTGTHKKKNCVFFSG